ncbi:hypothetical protein ACNKHO_02295 [Shigella flexneri]
MKKTAGNAGRGGEIGAKPASSTTCSMHAVKFAHTRWRCKNRRLGAVTIQDHYNLIYREEERDMLPLCVQEGVAVIPWSPLRRVAV